VAVPMTLQVLKGDTLVEEKDFDRDIIKIGRLSTAHLCLDDEKVSRIHSVIESGADGTISIIDMGSVEGTFVNGKRVNKGTLSFGDEIRVGQTLIRLQRSGAQAEALQAAAASVADDVASDLAAAAAASAARAAVVAPPPPPSMDEEIAFDAAPAVRAAATAVAPPSGDIVHRPVERVRPTTAPGKGTAGLEVRIYWGDTLVGEYFLSPDGKKDRRALSVGSGPGVGFVMGDKLLPGPEFEVARTDAGTHLVRFTKKMDVTYTRGEKTMDGPALIAAGVASPDGDDAYAVNVSADGFVTVDLGGVTLEAFQSSKPKAAAVPFLETLDFGFLNILLVMLIVYALFVVATLTSGSQTEGFADELSGNQARLAKFIVKQAEAPKTNRFLQKLEQKAALQANAASKGAEGKAGSRSKEATNKPVKDAPVGKPDVKDRARDVVAGLFGGKGAQATLGGNVGIGGELQRATGGLTGSSTGTQAGFGGLGLRGESSGGGGTGELAVIGGVGTKGRGSGDAEYGSKSGTLGGKRVVDVAITSSEPVVQGSLDPALIRKVIQSNLAKIKFCYESQLTMNPNLAGQVKVRFVIAGTGRVADAKVDTSSIGNATVEQCVVGRVRTFVFPKPKGGGTVIVAYPFIFKSAGG